MPAMTTDYLFDEAALRAITEAAGMTPVELLELYFDDARQTLNQIQAALMCADGVQIGRLAHMLKSSAGNVGAVAVAQTARMLEHQCKAGFAAAEAALCAHLLADHEAFVLRIERERERLNRG